MKNRILGVILALTLIMGMGTSAQAIGMDEGKSLPDEVLSELEFGFVDLDETDFNNNSCYDTAPNVGIPNNGIIDNNDTRDTRAVHNPDLYIKQLIVQPVMYVFNVTTGEFVGLYQPKGIYRYITYSANTTGLSQFGHMSLTTAQTNKFYAEAVEATKADPDLNGLSFIVYGWHITSYYQCIATKPQYILSRPYRNNVYGEYEKRNVTGQSATVELECLLSFPDNDPTVCCRAGIDGAFYFIYTTGSNAGKQGGAALTASLTTNSDAA